MKDPKKMTTKELIDLADKIKGDLTSEFINRMKKVEPKVPLVLKSG